MVLQEEQLRKLYKKHRKERGYLRTIASKMDGSFRKSQIGTHLRKLGLKLQVSITVLLAVQSRFQGSEKGNGCQDCLTSPSYYARPKWKESAFDFLKKGEE